MEANECSGTMVYAMQSLLSDILPAYSSSSGVNKEIEFYPFLHFDLMDEWDFSSRVRPSIFPTQDSDSILKWIDRANRNRDGAEKQDLGSRFTVYHGDFLNIYGENSRRASFDVVVTCFFIDTFSDIMQPLLVVQHILKPGGLWINAGPLHYHGKAKIPYSYVQLERIISSLKFIKIFDRTINSDYYGEGRHFMKPQIYNFPLSVWKLEHLVGANNTTMFPSALQKVHLKQKAEKSYESSKNCKKFTLH